MKTKAFNKVFCIGMNKTGTSSLHRAFLALNLNSLHHGFSNYQTLQEHLESAQWIRDKILDFKHKGEPLIKHIEEYDTYSDIGPIVNNFELLDIQYPGSKFIYTNRNTDDWIKSRQRHVTQNIKKVTKDIYKTSFVNIEVEKWVKNKEKHYQRVQNYFKNRPNDFLEINVCEGDGYEKLCPFLQLDMLDGCFPRANVSRV